MTAKKIQTMSLAVLSVLAGALAAPAAAEEPALRRQVIRRVELTRAPGGAGEHTVAFSLFGDSLAGKTVKGAPFAATAVTEIEQPLADGNRIRQRSAGALARDSAGRTRREMSPGAIGPLLAAGEPHKLVHIHDPNTGTSLTLDETRKKAFRASRPAGPGPHKLRLLDTPSSGPGEKLVEEDVIALRGRPALGVAMGGGPGGLALPLIDALPADLPAPVREDLGSQTIEGMTAQGTRSTVTIPAGKVGNERPLAIVSERWVSAELGLTVLSRHSDPRLGTTTYRLTGIDRREPPAAMFEIPSGYGTEEGPVLLRRTLKAKP